MTIEELEAENNLMREIIEEIIQAATPGSPPWAVIPDDLIEKAKGVIVDGQPRFKCAFGGSVTARCGHGRIGYPPCQCPVVLS